MELAFEKTLELFETHENLSKFEHSTIEEMVQGINAQWDGMLAYWIYRCR